MQWVELAEDQIPESVSPVLDVGRFVDYIVFSALFVRDVLQGLDGVLATWVNKQTHLTFRCADHPVGCIDLVFNGPRSPRADAAKPESSDDVVIRPASR